MRAYPVTGDIHRFMAGPKGSGITVITWSSNRRTAFVGNQHPSAPFPDGDGVLARSIIVALKQDDNAVFG